MAEAEDKYVPLTVNAITRELALERVNLLSLVANLHLSVNKLVEIEQQPSHTDQLRATVEYWLSVDPTPSWRRLLCALDQEDAHAAAVKKVKPHVEPLTDPSLTAENVSSVLETVRSWGRLCYVLHVPYSRQEQIETEYSTTETQWRQEAVDWWLQCSPNASWTWLVGRLYYYEEKTALKAASKYIQKETADPSLTPTNLWRMLHGVTDWSDSGLSYRLQIPDTVEREICQQTADSSEQRKLLLERWLRDHPVPSWAVVAEALYMMREHSVLEQLRRMYITGPSKQLFEEAMRHGHINSRVTKVLVTGIAGSGKTCTKHVLIDEPPPPVRKSTPCAEPPLRLRLMKVGVRRRGIKWAKVGSKRLLSYIAAAVKLRAKLRARQSVVKQPSDGSDHTVETGHSDPSSKETSATRQQYEATINVATKEIVFENEIQETLSAFSGSGADVSMSASPQSVVESILEASVTEEELVRLIERSVGSELLHEIEWVQFVDSGGQPQFLEVYPVFHRRTSVWIFVLKLSERLDQYPTVEYYDEAGRLVCKPYTAAHSSLQILLYSIQSLRSLECAPKILIVGTHKDKENDCDESREAKNQKLREMLLPEFENELIFCGEELRELIFPLNAQSPGEDEKRIAEEIRKVIMEHCSPQTDTLPLGWYCLELKLKEIAEALGQQVISWKVCFDVARKLHFDEQSLNAALTYLDDLNIIFYYRDVLSEMIFCDTQVLLDKVTELVHMSYKLRGNPDPRSIGAFGAQWRRFRDYGVVSSRFLECDAFKKHYVPGLFTPRELIKLFKSLLVLADFSEKGCYFMPCLLNYFGSMEVKKHRSSTSFILYFPQGARNGIFCSLISYLISNTNTFPGAWNLAVEPHSTTPVCLSRNCVIFAVPDFPGTVTLIDSFTDFYEVHINVRIELCPTLCLHVRDAMVAGLETVTTNLHYTNSNVKIAIPCPCGEGEFHPATVGVDQTLWMCSIDRAMYGKLDEKQRMWIASKPTLQTAPSTIRTAISAAVVDMSRKAEIIGMVQETCEALESTVLNPKADGQLREDDLVEIMGYLYTLDKTQLTNLGLVLGLSLHRVRGLMDSATFLADMVLSWLNQADQVATKSGVPTWKTLIYALRHRLLGQNGIANQIAMDQSLE